MRPLAFVLGLCLALSGLNTRGELTPYVASLQDAPMRAVYEGVKGAVHQVILPEAKSSCTAVARSASVLMFAEHCLRDVMPTVAWLDPAGGVEQLEVERVAFDGFDHVLIRFKGQPFTQWAQMATERPTQGDWVFLYGAPGRFGDLLRFGNFAGQEGNYIIYDLRTDRGDSGGAIFNAKGEVLDIVYGAPNEFMAMTLCLPIAFGRSQEAWVGL